MLEEGRFELSRTEINFSDFFHADFGMCCALCSTEQSTFRGGEKGEKVLRKGKEKGWPARGAKRKKGRVKTGQIWGSKVQVFDGQLPGRVPPLSAFTSFWLPPLSQSLICRDHGKRMTGKIPPDVGRWYADSQDHMVLIFLQGYCKNREENGSLRKRSLHWRIS